MFKSQKEYFEFLDASVSVLDVIRTLRDYGSWTEEKYQLILALDQTVRDFTEIDYEPFDRQIYNQMRNE
jgi:hypothetical protein